MGSTNTDFRTLPIPVDGTDGTDGIDGDNGLSAYQIAVNNGFIGTEQEWLASLQAQLAETFETVSQNFDTYPNTVTFVNGLPSTVVVNTGTGTITKTITFTSGKPTSVVLSGDTPTGIQLTKTISYGVDTINISYS